MKEYIAVILLATFSIVSHAENRLIFNGYEKSINLGKHGLISVIKSKNNFQNMVLLVKEATAPVEEERILYTDAVHVLYSFLKKYKIPKLDRKIVGYGVLRGSNFLGDNLYIINVSELMRLNGRDFGANDLLNSDDGAKITPVRSVLNALEVISFTNETRKESETRQLRSVVGEFEFGGGIVEGRIEKNYSKSAKTGSFVFFANMPEDKGSYYYYGASCKEGGSAFVNIQKDSQNVFCWGGNTSGCEVGIGVEAAMKKGCGG